MMPWGILLSYLAAGLHFGLFPSMMGIGPATR